MEHLVVADLSVSETDFNQRCFHEIGTTDYDVGMGNACFPQKIIVVIKLIELLPCEGGGLGMTYPSISYSWNAQSSLSSIFPRDVMLRAQINSLKSMEPDLSESKTLKT